MRRYCSWFLVVTMLACTSAFAAPIGITVKATKGFNTNLDVKVPEIKIQKTDVLGKPANSVFIPNAGVTFEKNAPELPFLSTLLMIDPQAKPELKIDKGQPETVSLDAPVVPSKGNFTRDIDPQTVPYVYGNQYKKDEWYPKDSQIVTIEAPFIFRDIRGVRLMIQPVQYNPVKNQIRIYRNLEISVNKGSPDTRNTLSATRISKFFEPIYQNTFLNFNQVSTRLPRLNENGRLLVITYDSFAKALEPFIAWKQKSGITVKTVTTSEILAASLETPTTGTPSTTLRDGNALATPTTTLTANQIKAFIQKEYDLGGLTHIILVGDAEQIPTLKGVKESADSDPCYTKLAGNDDVPDCIISRISATTSDEVAYQVAKFVNYEQFPETGASATWYLNAMGIASNQGSPTDFQRAEWLRNGLMGIASGATSTATLDDSRKRIFASVDQNYDPKTNKNIVADGINQGRSLINYIGHGSSNMWVTTGFNNNDCNTLLKNGWRMPIIWSVACVNGSFVGKTCFCEAFMRTGNIDKPAGAVAMFGASTNMEWVPPCIVQSEINLNYIVKETYKTVGGLAMNGIMKGLEEYGTDPKGSGVMMLEQWHLFGDATLLVRFAPPTNVTVTPQVVKSFDHNVVNISALNSSGKPVEGARVTVYTPKFETVLQAVTNNDGQAVITLPPEFGTEGYLTITGNNVVPVVDQKLTF
ncbi:MAG: hypothetical protein HQM08_13720 [Candidatus Riflebacteria bacterium]|nr:hypothetical protein [Candidatus Riflebacteria bacterium]